MRLAATAPTPPPLKVEGLVLLKGGTVILLSTSWRWRRADFIISSVLIFILLEFFAYDVHCLVQAGLYCSLGNADNLRNLGNGKLLLIMQGEDLMQRRQQFGEHSLKGCIEGGSIEFHLYLLAGDGVGIERGQLLCLVASAASSSSPPSCMKKKKPFCRLSPKAGRRVECLEEGKDRTREPTGAASFLC